MRIIKYYSVLGTRGHAYKLFKPRCTASIRSNFFAGRVINIWNSLPVSVNFSTLKSFRRTIQSVDFSSFLKFSWFLCTWYAFSPTHYVFSLGV